MKLSGLLHRTRSELPGVTGVARVDRHTGALLRRLRPGDIAVLDQVDLDRATADALVAARGRRGRQRLAVDLRAVPQPRARDPRRRRHPAGRRGRRRGAARRQGRQPGPPARRRALRRRRRCSPRASRRPPTPSPTRWSRPSPGWPTSWRRSPPTPSSSCGASGRCCSTASACPTSQVDLTDRQVLVVAAGYDHVADLAPAAPVHPRVPAAAGRRGRGRRRAARRRAPPRPHRRQPRRGVGRGADLRRGRRRPGVHRRPRTRPAPRAGPRRGCGDVPQLGQPRGSRAAAGPPPRRLA